MAGSLSALVGPDWLDEHGNDPKVRLIEIDWDGTDDYQEGHIPGAIGWNWKDALWDPLSREFPTRDEFAQRLGCAGIRNDTTVVFYGCPVQFGAYGWWVFKYCGHKDARILDGGRTRWIAEGRPLTKTVPDVSPARYQPTGRAEHMRASRDDVLMALEDRSIRILDHRSPEEYAGQMVGVPGRADVGAERYGRIPGARHLHFMDLLNTDDTFKSEKAVREIFEAAGATDDTKIISYCRLSHRATLAYFAMSELLGYRNVRTYDGSWTEWGSVVGVPIER